MIEVPALARLVTLVVIHCAYTPANMDIGVAEIDRWHRQEGWWGIGYHYVIRRDGTIEAGRPLDEVGAHAAGHNHQSIGIVLVGGKSAKKKPTNNFKPEQFEAAEHLLKQLDDRIAKFRIRGHGELEGHEGRQCPCFDMDKFRARLSWYQES